MKLEVNIEKKYAIAIFVGILILAGGIVAYAFGTGNPIVMGHSTNEIAPPTDCPTNHYLRYTGVGGWDCAALNIPMISFSSEFVCDSSISTLCSMGASSTWAACFLTSTSPSNNYQPNDGCEIVQGGVNWELRVIKLSGSGNNFVCRARCIRSITTTY